MYLKHFKQQIHLISKEKMPEMNQHNSPSLFNNNAPVFTQN